MPICTAICSVSVFAALLSIPVAGIIISHPASQDAYTVIGAILASVVALIEARKKDRTLGHTVSVFLGSAIMGSVLPGILYQLPHWRDWFPGFASLFSTWQAWAGAGFICGLNGWWIMHAVSAAFRKRAEAAFLSSRRRLP